MNVILPDVTLLIRIGKALILGIALLLTRQYHLQRLKDVNFATVRGSVWGLVANQNFGIVSLTTRVILLILLSVKLIQKTLRSSTGCVNGTASRVLARAFCGR